MKKSVSFPIDNFTEFRNKMLNWAQPFNIFCFLDNSQYELQQPAFECLLAAGAEESLQPPSGQSLEALKLFSARKNEWLFGHLCYDLKNETEHLSSANMDGIGFPDCHFFVPQIVLQLSKTHLLIYSDQQAATIFQEIRNCPAQIEKLPADDLDIRSRISPEEYISRVRKLQQHILRGDCYEINFCQEFYATDAVINPLAVYDSLITLSPNPFAALYKLQERYCICASPERYFKLTDGTICSQPIKGTAQRDLRNSDADERNRKRLANSEKEKSENVMVVDLVRNDLSRVCKEGTVKVEELYGVYSFPQVHQLISTICGELEDGLNWVDVVAATFPMGSMTGAPKKRVMELVEEFEQTRRGLFSGAIGYVAPGGNADFNVVIRSILYNAASRYLSFQAGGAITFYSDATEELRESLLKVAAIRKVLGS